MSLFPKFNISCTPAKPAKPAKPLIKKASTLATLAALAGPDSFQKNNSVQSYAYRFRLHNSEGGGTYLTNEADLDSARNSLLDRYGDRLALVAKA